MSLDILFFELVYYRPFCINNNDMDYVGCFFKLIISILPFSTVQNKSQRKIYDVIRLTIGTDALLVIP